MNYKMKRVQLYITTLLVCLSNLALAHQYVALSDTLSEVLSSTAIQSDDLLIDHLDEGEYRISIDVFIASKNTQKEFFFQLSNPWHSIPFDISDVDGGRWVTLTKEVTFDDGIDQASMGFFLPFDRDKETKSDFYIGDINILKTGDITNIEEKKNRVIIYPNPTQGIVNIQGENIQSVYVFDAMGIQKKHYDTAVKQLNFKDNQKGIYIIKLLMKDNSIQVRKVVLN